MWVIAILIFIIGTIFGSFYLVIATRLPKGENAITSRSRCDYCQKQLHFYEMIPLISFLVLKGKCRHCHQKIKSEHFWVELITGILFLLSFLYFGISYEFFLGLIIVSLMVIIFISDFKYMIILNSPLIISSILSILIIYLGFGLKQMIINIISGIILFCIMFLIQKIGNFLFKKDSLGGGDIKFSFVMGLTLGYKLGIVALILSTFLALPYALTSVYISKNHEFPYGPFLAGSLFIVFFHYEKFNLLLQFLFPF